jgi:hypothetical protein
LVAAKACGENAASAPHRSRDCRFTDSLDDAFVRFRDRLVIMKMLSSMVWFWDHAVLASLTCSGAAWKSRESIV